MNNKQPSFTSHIIYNLSLVICLFFSTICSPFGGMPGGFDPSSFTEEDMAKMDQGLMQVQKEIDDYVGSLSPEEQKEFFDTVQQVEEMMSNMSEDELAGFLQEMTDEMMQEMEQLEQKETPTPTAPTEQLQEKPIEQEEKSQEELQRELSVKALIDSLIEHTGSFIIKAQNISDLSQLIDRWSGQQKIVNIPEGESAENVIAQIELFQQKLYTLKTTMPKNEASYVFFDKLVEQEDLFTELTNLEDFLNAQEPKLTVSALGIEKLSSDSKTLLQQILSAYARVLYPMAIVSNINKLLETYEPIAAEVRKEMEQARKRAEELQRMQGRIPPGAASGYGRSGNSYGYGDDYYGNPYGDRGAYGNYGHSPSQRGVGRNGQGKPSGGEKGKKDTESKTKDKKDKSVKTQEDEKKKPAITPSTFCVVGESVEENIKIFKDHYMVDLVNIANHTGWKNFKTNIQAENFGEVDNKVDNKIKFILIPSAKTHLEASVSLVKRMQDAPMTKEQITTMKNAFTSKRKFTQLMNELDDINNNFASLKVNEKAKAAYFAGNDSATKLPGLYKDLATALNDLKEKEEKTDDTKNDEKK